MKLIRKNTYWIRTKYWLVEKFYKIFPPKPYWTPQLQKAVDRMSPQRRKMRDIVRKITLNKIKNKNNK